MSTNPDDWNRSEDSQMAAYRQANPGVSINGVEQPAPSSSENSAWSTPPPKLSEVTSARSDQAYPLALASMFVAFIAAPVGIVLGVYSLVMISRTGHAGRGFAIAGIVIGISVMILMTMLFLLPWFMFGR